MRVVMAPLREAQMRAKTQSGCERSVRDAQQAQISLFDSRPTVAVHVIAHSSATPVRLPFIVHRFH